MLLRYAEPNKERLMARTQAILGDRVSAKDFASIIAGDLTTIEELPQPLARRVLDLTLPEQGLEAIQGKTIDFLEVANLDLARAASRSVMRIQVGQSLGTGFMISPTLLMTNHHVLPDFISASRAKIQFDYENDIHGAIREITEFNLEPNRCFLTSPIDELDYTIVALGTRFRGEKELSEFGYLPLSAAGNKHAIHEFLNIIQHPEGSPKMIALRENRVFGRGKKGFTLYYGADTLPGSSGSPVLNDEYEVVALHHAGAPMNDKTFEDGRQAASGNEGIRISAIIDHLQNQMPTLPSEARDLLNAMIQTKFRGPSLMFDPPFEAYARSQKTSQSEQGVLEADGSVRWTIPVHLSIKVGDIAAPNKPVTKAISQPAIIPQQPAVAQLENRRPLPDYETRQGYDPMFLGVELPLPKPSKVLTKQLLKIAANQASIGDLIGAPKTVLHYHHYSLAIHQARKLACFTIVNIDGSSHVAIKRDEAFTPSQTVLEALEGNDVWIDDPRIPIGSVTNQKWYSSNSRFFDRGHLVRREDPNWDPAGDRDFILKCNDDTFHFTNCSPQIWFFNQRTNHWLGIEDYVLGTARAFQAPITVISGPIFKPDDPEIDRMQIPQTFFKIMAFIDSQTNQLSHQAFLASQEDLMNMQRPARELFEAREAKIVYPEAFEADIQEIEALTGLHFSLS